MTNKTKGFLALLASGLIFGSFGVWIRLLSHDLTNFQQIAFRNFVALIIAIVLIAYFKIDLNLRLIKDKKHLIRFGIAFPLAVVFFTYSLLLTKIMLGIFSFYVGSILFSLIIGIYVFKERLDTKKFVSLILVLVGLLLFVYPFDINKIDKGIVFGIISGFFDAVSNSYRKFLSGKLHRILLTSVPIMGGLLMSIILMFVNNETFLPQISATSWLVGVIFGALLFLVNYLTFIGFSNFDLNLGTIVISSELFFASLFGLLVYNEFPLTNELIGGFFILFSIIVSNAKIFSRQKRIQ